MILCFIILITTIYYYILNDFYSNIINITVLAIVKCDCKCGIQKSDHSYKNKRYAKEKSKDLIKYIKIVLADYK